ncbi:endonuclease/exonuclease/phosphatase family protein [Candidatus Saccharibacteria bacterium]|nr:endonuclease/exonuclease/phosphatase family protein [Candidatus Saccharibacteria bacterium]
MKCATFNVLADAYISYANYSHVAPDLLLPNARISGVVQLVNDLDADVIGLQEVDKTLLKALDETGNWQTFWSPKGLDKPDGCLTLVKHDVAVGDFNTHYYADESGHVMQSLEIGQILFTNTHIKWAPIGGPDHAGINQTAELISRLGPDRAAVIFADCNDRPGGPVRRLIEKAGFINAADDEPTATVNKELISLDILAVRGIAAVQVTTPYYPANIPNRVCPSDHIPLLVTIEVS